MKKEWQGAVYLDVNGKIILDDNMRWKDRLSAMIIARHLEEGGWMIIKNAFFPYRVHRRFDNLDDLYEFMLHEELG